MSSYTVLDRPVSSGLVDNFGRIISYLRLSITDRCNLRCRYCMPESGVKFLDHREVLGYEEMERLVDIAIALGIKKFRITGGEPFARKGCMDFLTRLKNDYGVEQLHLTTNGTLLLPHLQALKDIDIAGINLSLDTVNRKRFAFITRREQFDEVMAVFRETMRLGIPLKINSVVQDETSDQDLVDIAELVLENDLQLRFIEMMPFSGKRQNINNDQISLEERLFRLFPKMVEVSPARSETARKFMVPGAKGTLGLIEGHSRKFCASCNKIRITSQGMLKTCLYDSGVLDLRQLLRSGADDDEIADLITDCVQRRFENGKQTEKLTRLTEYESMSRIGG